MEQAILRIKDALRHVSVADDADAQREARIASDRRLMFSVTDTPARPAGPPYSIRLAETMAAGLGLPVVDLRVVEFGQGPRGRRFARRGQASGEGSPGQTAPPGPPGSSGEPGPPEAPPVPDEAGPPPSRLASRDRIPAPGGPSVGQRLDRAMGQERQQIPFERGRRPPRFRDFQQQFPRGPRVGIRAGCWLLVRRPGPGSATRLVAAPGRPDLRPDPGRPPPCPALWIAATASPRTYPRPSPRRLFQFGRNPDAPQLPEHGALTGCARQPCADRQPPAAGAAISSVWCRTAPCRPVAAVSLRDLRTPLAGVRFTASTSWKTTSTRDALSAEDVQQMDRADPPRCCPLHLHATALPNAEQPAFRPVGPGPEPGRRPGSIRSSEVTFSGPEKLTVEGNLAARCSRVPGQPARQRPEVRRPRRSPAQASRATWPWRSSRTMGRALAGLGMEEAIFEPVPAAGALAQAARPAAWACGLAIARNLARGHRGDIDLLEPIAPRYARVRLLPCPWLRARAPAQAALALIRTGPR